MPTEPLPGPVPDAAGSIGLLLFLLAGVFAAADRGAVFLERWGPRVFGLRRLGRRWARATVEREHRDEALARLADSSDAILAAIGSNGHTLHDRFTAMEAVQRQTREDVVDIRERLADGSDWMRNHEALHREERTRRVR